MKTTQQPRTRLCRSLAVAKLLALSVTMGTLLFASCGPTQQQGQDTTKKGSDESPKVLKVGFVTVGAVSDWGWNYQHDQGRKYLEEALKGRVSTTLVENVAENADAERVMRRMADDGTGLIFSTSYGYADFMQRAAKGAPGCVFMQAQAPVTIPNGGTYNGAIWEASYVAGVVAAMSLPNEKHFGFVGAQPIPPINWTVNAFTLGARSINPDVTVDIVYTNSWSDPSAEAEAVRSLARRDVKLVYALVDSTLAAVQAAEQEGIHSVSHHADLLKFAPKGYITGAVWNWGNLYRDIAKGTLDGTWKPGDVAGGLDKGYVGLASFGPSVPESAKERAKQVIQSIISGETKVFAGPIKDNRGKERVAKGESLTVPQIISMDWLVEGVHDAR